MRRESPGISDRAVFLALSELLPWPRNYRQHPAEQLSAICRSLSENGQYRPILVQASSKRIIAGHGVVEAARALKWKEIECLELEVSDSEAERLLVDDNEMSRLSTQDDAALLGILTDLLGSESEPYSYRPGELEEMMAGLEAPALEVDEKEAKAVGVKCPRCGHEF